MSNRFARSRGRLAVLAGVACAAILLPVAALAASTGQGTASRPVPVAPKCTVAMPALRGGAFVWSGNPGNQFAGGSLYELEVTNTGRHPCTLQGVPGLAAIGRNGHLVGSKIPASTTGPLVVLGPFQTAHINLIIHDASPICGTGVFARFFIYLPGQHRASATFFTGQACPGRPGGGVLHAGAITAGVGIPLYTT